MDSHGAEGPTVQDRTLLPSRPPRHQKPGDRRAPAYRKRNSHEVSSGPFQIRDGQRLPEARPCGICEAHTVNYGGCYWRHKYPRAGTPGYSGAVCPRPYGRSAFTGRSSYKPNAVRRLVAPVTSPDSERCAHGRPSRVGAPCSPYDPARASSMSGSSPRSRQLRQISRIAAVSASGLRDSSSTMSAWDFVPPA
jgi:hypothetical protein